MAEVPDTKLTQAKKDTRNLLGQIVIWASNQSPELLSMVQWALRPREQERLEGASTRLADAAEALGRPLRMAICGENNAGKSAMVNALIGREVAVTDFMEFTFCPMVFSHGTEEEAVLVLDDGTEQRLPISEVERELRERAGQGKVDGLLRVEIVLNAPSFKQYQIADVPGVGADERNEKVADAFAEKVDAVLFLCNATLLGQLDLLEGIKRLAQDFEALAVVVNKIDEIGMENADEAVRYAASMDYGRPLPVFPMVAQIALEEKLAGNFEGKGSTWLKTIEKDFLAPIADDEFAVKSRTALAKVHREVTGMVTAFQSAHGKADRAMGLVEEALEAAGKAKERILETVEHRTLQWANDECFRQVIEPLTDLVKQEKLREEEDFQEAVRQVFTDEAVEKEAKRLLDFITGLINDEWGVAASQVADACVQKFSPFQLETTNQILLPGHDEGGIRHSLPPGTGPATMQRSTSILLTEQAMGSVGSAEEPLNPDDMKKSAAVGLLTGGAVTTVSTALTTMTVGGAVAFVGIPLAIAGAAGSLFFKYAQRKQKQADRMKRMDYTAFINSTREEAVSIVIKKAFPSGLKQEVGQELDRHIALLRENLSGELWQVGDHKGCLETARSYIDKGVALLDDVVSSRKVLGGTVAESIVDTGALQAISVSQSTARGLFHQPVRYSVEDANRLLEELGSILGVEDAEVSIVDRGYHASNLLWLNRVVPEDTMIKILLYDIERDSVERTEFIRALESCRLERTGAIAVRAVKFEKSDRTPLDRHLVSCTGMVLELGGSLSAVGTREINVVLLSGEREEQARRDYFHRFWTVSIHPTKDGEVGMQFIDI